MITMPFLFAGSINIVKSLWAGRKGPSIFQPFYDFIKLLRKGEAVSVTTTPIFTVGPSIYLASVITACLFVPFGYNESVLSFSGDFIVFAYIMTAGNFFIILSAMDTGSSFEGMGASREVTFALFSESSLFLILASFLYLSGFSSISKMMSQINFTNSYTAVASILSIIAFFIMLLSEGKRVPIDDPNTHLELTMVHEVMILDHSGPNLGFINYAVYLKMAIFNALISSIIFTESGILFSIFGFVAVSAISAFAVGTIESILARLRIAHIPQFLLMLFGIAIFIITAILMGRQGGA